MSVTLILVFFVVAALVAAAMAAGDTKLIKRIEKRKGKKND